MPRTLAQVDTDLATLEAWRAATVDPSLTQATNVLTNHTTRLNGHDTAITAGASRLDALETFANRVKAAWRALTSGGQLRSVEDDSDAPLLALQQAFTADEMREIRWLIEERRKVSRR